MVSNKATVKCLSTIICQTSNMDRSVAYYRDVLGFTPNITTPYWSDFVVGGVRIGIHPPFEGSTAPYALPHKGWLPGFEVDDIRALRVQLDGAGARVGGYHDTPVGVVMDFDDPDGNTLQAIQLGLFIKDIG
jgi:catechol 2,3-dioxygenase-like lactoylglutathione lyase family enzyme